MRNNFIRIPANLIGLAKAAAASTQAPAPARTEQPATAPTEQPATAPATAPAPRGGSGRPTAPAPAPATDTAGGDSQEDRSYEVRDVIDQSGGVSPLDEVSEYDYSSHMKAENQLRAMQADSNTDTEALNKQLAIVKKFREQQVIQAQKYQSADNKNDNEIDWRPVDWDNSPLSGNLTVVRGTRLTPAQYGYYQRKVKEYGGDRNKAWQDVQSRFDSAKGKGHQMWVQTDEDKALLAQNQRALSQPPSGGQWYRSYGDDAQLGPGNTIRVKGAPSHALQRSAQARGMTIVSDARYYGNQGNWNRAADARRAAQYQNMVMAQQYSQIPQPQNGRGEVAPIGSWGDKNFDPRLVSNLENLASSNSATPMISYLVRNAGQIHNWLNENYNTPTGQKVIDALFKYSGAMNDVKNSWAKMTPAQQLQLKRNAAYTVLKSYFGNSLWSSEGQRPTESMAGMPVGANNIGAAANRR